MFSRATLLSSAPDKKHVQVRAESVDDDLRLSIAAAYQHGGQSCVDMPPKTDHAVPRYPSALQTTCPFDVDDNARIALGLRLANQLEDNTQPSVNVGVHSDYPEAKVKLERSRSLPASELDVAETVVDGCDNSPDRPCVTQADVSCQTRQRYRKRARPAEYQRSRCLSNTGREHTGSFIDRDSMSLLTAQGWTAADRPTTSAEIETVL